MAGLSLSIDPTSEDAANVALDLNDGTKFRLMEIQLPTPDRAVNWASSVDTEGAVAANLGYQNRQITIVCRVYGSSQSDLMTQLGYLEQKVGRANARENPTLKLTAASGQVCVFDLLEGSADFPLDNAALATNRTVATISFTAKPFWRSGLGAETTSTDHAETTLPVVVGTDTAPGGDVPALGRLVIDEDQGQDQWTLIWGVQSRYYDSSADAALFYEAEGRTVQGGAATSTALDSTASGSSPKAVLQGSLTPIYQSMLSTQATGGGNHLKHVGTYRVFGRFQRPTTNTGAVSVALSWGEGDFRRFTQNTAKTWAADEREGVWTFTDLGLVRLTKVVAGTQRWEGRIIAKSTVAGDDIYCDYLALFPVDEGYGEIKITPQLDTPTSFSARDEFDQTAGNLVTKVLPAGGSWTFSAGDVDDFTVDATNHRAQRATTSDTAARRIYASTPTALTNVVVQADVDPGATTPPTSGVVFRLVDASNYCFAWVQNNVSTLILGVTKVKAGAATSLGNATVITGSSTTRTLRVIAYANGLVLLYGYSVGGLPISPVISAFDSDLATGGTLASGAVGLYDANGTATAATRTFDNFAAWVPVSNAAVFASQSCEIRADRVVREDGGGTLWVPSSSYRGSYAKPPPTRREARSLRTIVKLVRYDIDTGPDSAIDDASFQWKWQTRGLVAPES